MKCLVVFVWLAVLASLAPAAVAAEAAGQAPWRAGLAQVKITPDQPIRMSGYASRDHPSEGVLADLYAKALAVEDAGGNRALLITADLIGFSAELAESIRQRIGRKTGLAPSQILLNPSHTHTGPMTAVIQWRRNPVTDEQRQVIQRYLERLQSQLADLASRAVAGLQPARLSWGAGEADFVMNRREFTPNGVRLGVNRDAWVDRQVPVLRIDTPEGRLRGVVFGCACHNTTLTGQHYLISGDYAGFAQEEIQRRRPGVQAMFMIGCGGDANPYPRGTVGAARRHGRALAAQVLDVLDGDLQPVRGPLRVELDWARLPLAPVPTRKKLLQMAQGPSYLAYNASRMLEAIDQGRPLPTSYRAPIAVWQFGSDLTLVALPGEVVSDYVTRIRQALGTEKLWIAGYANDVFGYLVSARDLAEGGYETRGLFLEAGYLAPEVEQVVVEKVQQLAARAGRPPQDP